jgi:tRNA1Val (adenine37-N6)-methyltransferase
LIKPSASHDETLSSLLDGDLRLLQSKKGYRFSVDALLLSRFATIRKDDRVIDIGTGCGVIPILLSRFSEARSFVGIEIQKSLASLAKRNVTLNLLQDRITIYRQDFRKIKDLFPPGSFDVVLSNPPYRRHRAGRLNPSMEKAIARHEMKGTLEELTEVIAYLLPPKGRSYLIYSASRAIDLFVNLRENGLEPKRLQWVHSHLRGEANFILAESLRNSGPEVRVMPPLTIHEPTKK